MQSPLKLTIMETEKLKTEKLEQELAHLKEAEKTCEWNVEWHEKKIQEEESKLKAFNERILHLEEVLKNQG